MIKHAKQLTFGEGAVLALGLSLVGGLLHWLLAGLFSASIAMLIAVFTMASSYAVYLLKRSVRTTGSLISGMVFFATSIAVLLLPISILAVLTLLLFGLWVLRCCYYRKGIFDSIADLGLTAIGALAAVFAAYETQSMFVSFWTFFIVQAFHVYISALRGDSTKEETPERRFNNAFCNAETALRQFYSSANH